MDFSFSPDQQLLKNSARAFLDEHMKPAHVRALWDDPRGESETLWKEMAQLGWLGLALPEDVGGSALGLVERAGTRIVPTTRGFLMNDAIARALLSASRELDSETGRHRDCI